VDATAPDLQLLRVFVAVAEASSFSKAATQLGVTKATVSRSIARLEAEVGAELLHRTTHRVALSTAGTALYERTASHVHALASAIGDLPERAEEPSGQLRITAPHDLGTMLLPDVLTRFRLRHPLVRFDVRLSNEAVDLVAEGFDLAIRAGRKRLRDSSLVARKIASIEGALSASPGYIARRGEPRSLADAKHCWVAFGRAVWLDRELTGRDPHFRTDDLLLLRGLVAAGAGIGALPTFIAHPLVVSGALVRVLADTKLGEAGACFVVYPSSRQVPRKVAAFRDFLVETLGPGLGELR
jgi:DNA-binding transcriptional LysR family regulator